MDLFWKLSMIAVFFAGMIVVGIWCRSRSRDVSGFLLGGRSVGPWISAFAYGTSYFSAVIFIGYAGQFGWNFGIAATWIGIGNALLGSLLAWVVLGRRTRLMTQHLDSATMPAFFGRRYGSRSLTLAASVIIFIFLIPYTASLYNGLSQLIDMAFPHIPGGFTTCVLVMAALTGVYVIVGGYMATAINDFIQGLVMLGGIVLIVACVLQENGGFASALEQLAGVAGDSTLPGAYNSFFGPQPLDLLSVVLLTSLGTWGLPQMVGKFYAIRSEKSISTGAIVSTLFAAVVAGGCYFLGGFSRLYADADIYRPDGSVFYDKIIPAMLENLPAVVIGLVLVLVLSASMSTLSSLVLTSSSTLTLDFFKASFFPKMKEKQQLLMIRVLIVVFVAISAAIAIVQTHYGFAFIAQLMGISWGALAGAFLAPFLYGLYWKRTTRAACWVSIIGAPLVMTAYLVLQIAFPATLATLPAVFRSPIHLGVVLMLSSLVLVPLISLCTRPQPGEELSRIFSCYHQKVTVEVTDSLGE